MQIAKQILIKDKIDQWMMGNEGGLFHLITTSEENDKLTKSVVSVLARIVAHLSHLLKPSLHLVITVT